MTWNIWWFNKDMEKIHVHDHHHTHTRSAWEAVGSLTSSLPGEDLVPEQAQQVETPAGRRHGGGQPCRQVNILRGFRWSQVTALTRGSPDLRSQFYQQANLTSLIALSASSPDLSHSSSSRLNWPQVIALATRSPDLRFLLYCSYRLTWPQVIALSTGSSDPRRAQLTSSFRLAWIQIITLVKGLTDLRSQL